MNSLTKNCPRCKTPLQQGNGAFELVKKGMDTRGPSSGISVILYSCPSCGYIELYDIKVRGHL